MLNVKNKKKNTMHFNVKRAAKGRWYAQMWSNSPGGYRLIAFTQKSTMKEALEACIR